MKKQYVIAIGIAALVIGVTGCSSKENVQPEATSAVITSAVTTSAVTAGETENAAKTTEAASMATPKTIDEKMYNTITDGIYISEHGEIQMQVPEGWKIIENDENTLIIPDKGDSITDNLHVQIAEKDENFSSYTKETFQKSFEKKFGEITFEEFEKTAIVGVPAIKIIYKIKNDDVETTEYQYMLDGNQTIIITYTNVRDLLSEEELETYIDSIQILK